MGLVRKMKNLLNLISGALPCCIISREPAIIISYWQDFLSHSSRVLNCFGDRRGYLLFQLGWHRETPERVIEIKEKLIMIQEMKRNLNFIFLCNSEKEQQLFTEQGLNAIFCHQNAFLDENRYKITHVMKKYDAIYIARITPFKRHELAAGITSLSLVGDYSEREKKYCDKIFDLLSHAEWKRKVLSKNIYKVINEARVGLCLSAEEGAMFVSAEYLLCGLPIVNTPNLGGRDALFCTDYVITIQNPTAQKIASAVAALIEHKTSPNEIRDATIALMAVHRQKFIDLIQSIYGQENCKKIFSAEWNKVFIHKMGLRSTVPIPLFIKRILKGRDCLG